MKRDIIRHLVATCLAGVCLVSSATAETRLRLGHYMAPEDFRARTAEHFAEQVNASKADLKVEVYPSESLVKGKEALQATSQGVVDIYTVFAGFVSGQVPVVNAFMLPFAPPTFDDEKLFTYANDPKVREILDRNFSKMGIKYLGAINSSGGNGIFARKPINGLSDFRGLKIRGPGGLSNDALISLGASVVVLSAAEQFLALQTGTVDAISTTYASYVNNKLSNVAPYQVDLSVVRAPYFLIMNQRKWQSLSGAQQAAVEAAVADTVKWSRVQTVKEEAELASKVGPLVKSSAKLSPEDYVQIKQATQSLRDKVIEQSGEDGRAMFEVVDSLAD